MGKNKDIPRVSTPIVETHCHLDYLKNLTLKEIIEKSHLHNIEKIITISVTPENFDQVREITNDHEHVYGTQGVHLRWATLFEII